MEELILNNNDLINIMSDYYTKLEKKITKVKSIINIKYINSMPHLTIKFYYERYIKDSKITVFIKESEIRLILENYLNSLGYTLVNYSYIGNIRHTGYFVDNDTPFFEGVKIIYNKNKIQKRKR